MKKQSSIRFVAGAFALLLLVPLMTGKGMQVADAAPAAGIIVPLYTYPGGTWDTVVKTKNNHPAVPIVAIVNPASGPGASKDSNYVSGIAQLKAAGVVVIGYVSTAYTSRSLAAVKGDIDKWGSWYGVDGIFFDEQTNWAGGESYYTQAGDYAESKGLAFTVGNPGANSLPSYLSTVDVVLIYESPGLPNLSDYVLWGSSAKDQLGMIPFSVSSLSTSWLKGATGFIGWVYVTSDGLPNPWDSLPTYFDDMAALLDGGSPTGGDPTHQMTVKSLDQTGNPINGMWTEVKQNGATVSTGYTPLTLTLKDGTYTVSAGNYQQIIFDHWSDGSKSITKSINLSSNTALTAYYNNGVVTSPLSVKLNAGKTTGLTGTSITFSASILGGTAPYTWSINYGDGTSSPYVSASTISKTYNKAGTYTAVANGRDATGKIATSNPVVLTITQSTSTLTVKTVNAANSAINGYYTTLWQNGALVKSAYSPTSFTLKNGQTYQLSVADYGGYVFDHWNDGSTIRQKTVTLKESTTLTAHYKTTPTKVTLTIESVGLSSPITGLWTVISGAGSTTGYTPLSYSANSGSQYTVTMGEYQNYVFDHWDNGSTSKSRTITPNSNTVLTAFYRQ
ncbi:MAG: hypothetical protein AUH71_00590 [Thaumarchaeota archaeon 13_1_40CM_4_48_7]|nr:MAG: hypothetical protein AUH71_00590 [Thaumarchaeota archaeon 13_1_40CM_4_48_7]